jgi:hypothetical protein
MGPDRDAARCEDLCDSALERSYPIVGSEFTPPALATRFLGRLRNLLKDGAATGVVLDANIEGSPRVAAATWVFLTDRAYDRLRTVPLPALDEWLVEEVLSGSGVLAREETARANAGAGLHLFMLYFKGEDACLSESGRIALVQAMRAEVFPGVLGYNLRSLSARIRHLTQVESGVQSGCRVMREDAVPAPVHGEFLPYPVILYAEREWVHFASWIAGAFAWRPPAFHFSAAEQRMLLLAMRGHRDEAIAAICGVGASTVKKRWDSVLARAASVAPDLFDGAVPDTSPGRRGREKRSRLLRFLATHLEELRPYQP